MFSLTLFSFREHGLNFGSNGSPGKELLSWITFQWDVEYIPFPNISTHVWVIYPGNTELFQVWTSVRVLWIMSGIYTRIRKWRRFCFSRKTPLKLKSRLALDRSFNFFLFSQNIKKKKDFQMFFSRAHAILWASFCSQKKFNSEFQLQKQLKKLLFSL